MVRVGSGINMALPRAEKGEKKKEREKKSYFIETVGTPSFARPLLLQN
jgi:hypothetical protein